MALGWRSAGLDLKYLHCKQEIVNSRIKAETRRQGQHSLPQPCALKPLAIHTYIHTSILFHPNSTAAALHCTALHPRQWWRGVPKSNSNSKFQKRLRRPWRAELMPFSEGRQNTVLRPRIAAAPCHRPQTVGTGSPALQNRNLVVLAG